MKFFIYAWLAIMLIICLRWVGCGLVSPGDLEMRLRFALHRSDLELLLAMSSQDPQMACIAPDFLWTHDSAAWPRPESEWGIAKSRWAAYRKIFKRSGFDTGLSRSETDLEVYAWASGIVAGGRNLSYLHCGPAPNAPTPREPACTERKQSGQGHYGNSTSNTYRYRKLTDDWFILEQAW